jgi:hypothetical protein
MIIWLIGVGLLVLAVAAMVSIGSERADEEEAIAMEQRVNRYEQYAGATERLREELGREPSVREILDAVYAEAAEDDGDDDWIDLRRRVSELIASLEATG